LDTNGKTPILHVQDLKTYYFKEHELIRCVDGISFEVMPGGRMGIAGESGSGKTQTVLSIMGLNESTPGMISGEIHINGNRITDGLQNLSRVEERDGHIFVTKDVAAWQRIYERNIKPHRGKTLSMVFQEPRSSLSPYFTIREQLEETLSSLLNGSRLNGGFEQLVMPLFERLKFRNSKQILSAYPHQLSGGESQRIMLALALLGEPQLLIADEPTTQLDALTQFHVVNLFDSILREKQLSLLFISHNLALVAHLVDTVCIMYRGRIVEKGPAKALITSGSGSAHPYTRELLNVFNGGRGQNRNGGYISNAGASSKGCRYQHRCDLKRRLDPGLGRRCENESPSLDKISKDHWVACWHKER